MPPEWINYFGYGSLVNRDTRPPHEMAINVTLKGWQRVWNHRVTNTDERIACTSLSIEPAEGSIEGVLVRIARADLHALDERESGYERQELPVSNFVVPDDCLVDTIHVYRSQESNRILADDQHPITQSYADCVMAGYQRRFGDDGLERLIRTTRGWERPIRQDRRAPTYPRSVKLSVEEQQQFDLLLKKQR